MGCVCVSVCSFEFQTRRSLKESEGVMSELHQVRIIICGSISASGIMWPKFVSFVSVLYGCGMSV